MQNSEVSFLTYSFSVSFLRRFRNSYSRDVKQLVDELWETQGTREANLDGIETLGTPIPLVS